MSRLSKIDGVEIVVYPGSFNPIHTGHVILASYLAQCQPGVDEVWLLVTPENPLKPLAGGASDSHRLEMARVAVSEIPGVRVSDFEFSLPRPSYTYATLRALAHKYPQHDFSLLIGSDNWAIFSKWRDWEKILSEFGVKIYLRPGFPVDEACLPAGAQVCDGAPQVEISSTFIRDSLAEGLNMIGFLPSGVSEYVTDNRLYGGASVHTVKNSNKNG